MLISQDLEESQLLDGGQLGEEEGGGGDGQGGCTGASQSEASGGGEGGGRDGVQQEDWLGDGGAQQAHGNGQCDQALQIRKIFKKVENI